MLQNKYKGYSILELSIAISLLAIIISSVILMISYATSTINNIFLSNEGYMNGKVSIEFISSEIERYSHIDIYNYDDNTIEKIIIFKNKYKLLEEANVIYFYKENSYNKSNCVYFGGYNSNVMYTNKFSSYIDSINISKNNNVISIQIETLDIIKNNKVKSHVFISKINVENKSLEFY